MNHIYGPQRQVSLSTIQTVVIKVHYDFPPTIFYNPDGGDQGGLFSTRLTVWASVAHLPLIVSKEFLGSI